MRTLTLLCRMVLTTTRANEACMVQGFTLQEQVARATGIYKNAVDIPRIYVACVRVPVHTVKVLNV